MAPPNRQVSTKAQEAAATGRGPTGGAAPWVAPGGLVLLAFAIVYLVWGSAYLAMKVAVETIPPFMMTGVRFVFAGAVLAAWALLRGAAPPQAEHWRSALIVGALLIPLGNGMAVWALQTVPSNLAALLVSTTPFWIVLLEWLRPGGAPPGRGVALGVLVGLGGIAVLLGPGELTTGEPLHLAGVLALLGAAFCWGSGSVCARYAPLPASPTLAIGIQMFAGGALLSLVSAVTGEPGRFEFAAVSRGSSWAFLYLLVFGSFISFSAYLWLLRVQPSHRVATHAYVNPVIAVFLGWWLLGETLGPQGLLGAAVIVAAVGLIVSGRARNSPPAPVARARPPDGNGGGPLEVRGARENSAPRQ